MPKNNIKSLAHSLKPGKRLQTSKIRIHRIIDKPEKHFMFGLNTILLAVLASIFITYLILKLGSSVVRQDQAEQTSNQARLLQEVGAIIDLPAEQPTIATVTNLDKLKSQPFFSKAQLNDTVLYYPQTKKVILYRSSERRIIEVATIAQNI
jgi:hypothetical protein